ncbi:MAG: hypothetical protein KDD63_10085, partial [Bacteroidetes bacterium]|nr:hypothetical protein [Bacteroidota bacterium]
FPTIVAPFNRRTTDSLKTPDAHLGAPYSLKNLFDLSAQIKLINQYEEEIQTKRNNDIYQTQPPVNEETEFKIFINNIRASYVYALKAESGKKIETLIQQSGNGENTFCAENQVISIHDGNNPIKLDQGTSKSYLCIFFSKNALNFPQLVSKMDKTKGDIVDKIDSVMGESLIHEEDISFLESEVGFSAFSRGKEMVALIIEMR